MLCRIGLKQTNRITKAFEKPLPWTLCKRLQKKTTKISYFFSYLQFLMLLAISNYQQLAIISYISCTYFVKERNCKGHILLVTHINKFISRIIKLFRNKLPDVFLGGNITKNLFIYVKIRRMRKVKQKHLKFSCFTTHFLYG